MPRVRFWSAVAIAALVGVSACASNPEEQPQPPRPVELPNGGQFESRAGSDAPPRIDDHPPPIEPTPVDGRTVCGSGNALFVPVPAMPTFNPGASGLSAEFQAPVVVSPVAPPPISGGTLFTTSDGKTLIAADPDRDAIYVIDVAKRELIRRIELSAKDEPGRVVQDRAGRIHVALRGGRSVASFALTPETPVTRSEVCDLPRGLAYDEVADRLYAACADGALVQFDPATGKTIKKLDLGRDLRDVIVRGAQMLVTRFRTAELLSVDMNAGRVMSTVMPRTVTQPEEVLVADPPQHDACGTTFESSHVETRMNALLPTVAWRAVDMPGRGVVMLHQRAGKEEVAVAPGAYGGSGRVCAPGIVHAALTFADDASQTAELRDTGLFVDMAVDSTGALLALANAGGYGTGDSVLVYDALKPEQLEPVATEVPCHGARMRLPMDGQATAVSFVSPWMLAVQQREPAAISFYDVRNGTLAGKLDLKQPSRYDTGHTLFHLTTGSGLACASCHAEGGDDSHVWTFKGIGPRRTQNLRGGILGSEPFHWNGDMMDFNTLVKEVFNGRMNAPQANVEQADALAKWIDVQPALHAKVADAQAVERGKVLFENAELGCTTCHTGPRLSRNEAADVGTGAKLQVPSLRGVSFRAPFMHDGCATTLADRFGKCGGGDKHGHTSDLKPEQIGDLVAYLQSL